MIIKIDQITLQNSPSSKLALLTCVLGICLVENLFRKESSRLSGAFFGVIAEEICTVVRNFIHLWFDLVLHLAEQV